MENDTILVLVALAVVVILVVGLLLGRKNRSKRLQSKFGPEYDQAVTDTGAKRTAEAELADRAKRVKSFDIRPLPPGGAESFTNSWTTTQARFVDDPKGAIAEADNLLGHLMTARGYPVSDFEQRAADLSVDHGELVHNYRAAHDVAVRHGRGEGNTEELRQAMIHYRALFEDLIDDAAGRGAARREPRLATPVEDNRPH